MNYPLQALIQLGVVPSVNFPTDSRYYGSATLTVHCARRHRSSPIWRAASCRSRARPTSPPSRSTRVTQGDRLDLIAAKYLGDPLMFWLHLRRQRRHRAQRSLATPGRVLAITTPQGVPGASTVSSCFKASSFR